MDQPSSSSSVLAEAFCSMFNDDLNNYMFFSNEEIVSQYTPSPPKTNHELPGPSWASQGQFQSYNVPPVSFYSQNQGYFPQPPNNIHYTHATSYYPKGYNIMPQYHHHQELVNQRLLNVPPAVARSESPYNSYLSDDSDQEEKPNHAKIDKQSQGS